jgi:heptaprenyl diphosphate synthase/octaprenyl-diphosphate synthase
VISEATEESIGALRDYGYNFGMAFQVVDDILDFTGDEAEMGKPVGSDLMQGTLTLPSLLLVEKYPDDSPVQDYFRRPKPETLSAAITMIRNEGIADESYEMARDFSRRACDALAPLPNNADRQTLIDLAEWSLERRS